MPHDKPKFVEFKIINNREEAPAPLRPYNKVNLQAEAESQSALADLNSIMARTYQDMFTNMLRNDNIMYARMKGYKRDREYGRRKWSFRIHSRAGRLLNKLGYWHLIDYIVFMGHTAKEAWGIKDYEYYRLSED